MELTYIKTALPFTDEELDKYFDDIESYFFHVSLEDSKYEGQQLLTYIYNSGMKANLETDKFSEKLEKVLVAYVTTDKIVNIPSMNDVWCAIIQCRVTPDDFGGDTAFEKFAKEFIEKHTALVDEVVLVLTALKSYLFDRVLADEELVERECDKEFKTVGHNIVSLRNAEYFWAILGKLKDGEDYRYKNFARNDFDGVKIGYFFVNEFNPFSLIYMARTASDEDIAELRDMAMGITK